MWTKPKRFADRLSALEASGGRKQPMQSKQERDSFVAAAIAWRTVAVPLNADMHQRAAIEAARRADS